MSTARRGEVVSKAQFARLVGFSQKQVGNWCDEGMPHVPGARGKAVKIDTAAAIQWLQDRAVRKEIGEQDTGPRGVTSAREDLVRHQAERARLDLEEAAGELISAALVEEAITGLAAALASALDGVAARVAGGDAVLRKRFTDEHRRVRGEVARRLEDLGDRLRRGGDRGSASGKGRMGVGRRETNPSARVR